MTPTASAGRCTPAPNHRAPAQWDRAPRRGLRPARLARGVLVALAALLLWQYLAGYLLLWSLKLSPLLATPLTALQYAVYYGERHGIQRRLMACAGTAAVCVVVCAAVAFRPRPRALHGEARFARRREIAAAGLLRA